MHNSVKVGTAPANVVIAGVKAYVSNQGGRPAASSDFTVDSSGTPVVANKESGYATTGTVSVVDLTTGTEVKTIEVGLHPTALLLDNGRLFVANTNSDTVSMIDVTTDRVVKTIAIKPFPGVLLGSSPNALAMIDDERLAVSLGRNNALALYSLKGLKSNSSGAVQFLGLIPAGWYPADLVADSKARRLICANNKGVGALGPEGTTGPYSGPEVKKGKSALNELGSVSIINFPTNDEVTSYTAQVLKNNNWSRAAKREVTARSAARKANPAPIPEQLGDPSVFKHVFYVIKENRTYDQVFGDLRQGNGDQNLVQFGRTVTPNHHALAEQFVLLDNLYAAGTRSVDGHQWLTQSFVVDYLEKAFGGFERAYPFTGGDSLAYPQTGFVWESAIRFGKSVRVYGEYVSSLYADDKRMVPRGGQTNAGGWASFYKDAQIHGGKLPGKPHVRLEARSDIPSLDQIICREYPPYHQAIPDQYRVEVFLREFNEFVKNRNLPDLVILALTSDHSQGTAPDYPTPAAMNHSKHCQTASRSTQ